jgi:hypothetical protein
MASTSSVIEAGEEQAAHYFEEIFAWCGQQNLNAQASLFVASQPAIIQFRDEPDVKLALSGLFSRGASYGRPTWNVRIGDRSSPNIPIWPWAEYFVTSSGGDFQFSLLDPDRAVLIDFRLRRAVLINTGNLRAHEFHIPLLRLSIAMVEKHGGAVLHAGVIKARTSRAGVGGQAAVAVVGKGGSGKSTLIASARAHGFECLGDDFVELRANGELRALFRTGRLTRTSPAYHQGLDTPGTYDPLTDKTVHYLRDELPTPAQLSVIVAPKIWKTTAKVSPSQTVQSQTHHRDKREHLPQCAPQPMTRVETLAAAVPSSVGASYQRAEAVRRLTKTLSPVPGFGLQVTEDLDGALREIAILLEGQPSLSLSTSASTHGRPPNPSADLSVPLRPEMNRTDAGTT